MNLSNADMLFLRRVALAIPDGAAINPETVAAAMRATCDRDGEILNATVQNLARGDGSYQRKVSEMSAKIHRRMNA